MRFGRYTSSEPRPLLHRVLSSPARRLPPPQIRRAGKLRHLNIGRAHRGQRVLALVHDRETMVIDLTTGAILAEHLIDPNRDYQPKKK